MLGFGASRAMQPDAASSPSPFEDHMKYIAANIEDDLMARVDKVATDLNVSRSCVVRLALVSYLLRPHRLVQDDPVPSTDHSPMTTEG